MQRPGFENKINLNTIILVLTLIGTGVGWGVNYQLIKSGQQANAESIRRLERDTIPEIKADIVALQTDARAYSNVQFRVGRLEDGFSTVTTNTRDLERAISTMAADIRVMRETVERLDRSLNGDASQRR